MFHENLDYIFNLPPEEKFKQLVNARENQWFERKSYKTDPKKLAESIIAFANAEGGVLVVGISQGELEDHKLYENKINNIRRVPINLVDPSISCHIETMKHEGKEIICFSVSPSIQLHRAVDGVAYVRSGDSSLKLDTVQERELFYDRTQSSFESENNLNVSDDDICDESIAVLGEKLGLTDKEDILNARYLRTPDGKISNAAYLLFAKGPQQVFPSAYVRVIEYDSIERGEGQNLNIKAGQDVRISGTVPQVIAKAEEVIKAWLPRKIALDVNGRFSENGIVPENAWREGLVNAVVHRSYSNQGDYIRVEIFPDRIEIESPGRFPGIVDMSNPKAITRFSRNPKIARVCSDLGITAELGEGIRRIYKEMDRIGLSDPQYYQTSGSVRLILRNAPKIGSALLDTLPKNSEKALDFLTQSGRSFGTGEIATALGQSRPTTLAQLNALLESGLITWTGKSSRDPRASWQAK